MRRTFALTTLLAAALSATTVQYAAAEPQTFNFQDPKGVNGIAFISDSTFEPFVGMGGGVQGEVTFDPDDPAATTGELSVAVDEMSVINPTMTDHMRGEGWLEGSERPRLIVSLNEVTDHRTAEDGTQVLDMDATISLGAMEIQKPIEVSATLLPDGVEVRGGAPSGDLLVLRSTFTVDRAELGIKPDMGGEEVARSIRVIAPLTGYGPTK